MFVNYGIHWLHWSTVFPTFPVPHWLPNLIGQNCFEHRFYWLSLCMKIYVCLHETVIILLGINCNYIEITNVKLKFWRLWSYFQTTQISSEFVYPICGLQYDGACSARIVHLSGRLLDIIRVFRPILLNFSLVSCYDASSPWHEGHIKYHCTLADYSW